MFIFEKFPVYIKTQVFLSNIQFLLKSRRIQFSLRDQLYRASTSILLNIAEGAGKFTKRDKKNFYTTARGSAQECSAIITILKVESNITEKLYLQLNNELDEIGKMLSALIKSLHD